MDPFIWGLGIALILIYHKLSVIADHAESIVRLLDEPDDLLPDHDRD